MPEIPLPKRKSIRIADYDYSTPGAYFITVCTANREKIFWEVVGADIIRPQNIPLSAAGKIAEQGILQMEELRKCGCGQILHYAQSHSFDSAY